MLRLSPMRPADWKPGSCNRALDFVAPCSRGFFLHGLFDAAGARRCAEPRLYRTRLEDCARRRRSPADLAFQKLRQRNAADICVCCASLSRFPGWCGIPLLSRRSPLRRNSGGRAAVRQLADVGVGAGGARQVACRVHRFGRSRLGRQLRCREIEPRGWMSSVQPPATSSVNGRG